MAGALRPRSAPPFDSKLESAHAVPKQQVTRIRTDLVPGASLLLKPGEVVFLEDVHIAVAPAALGHVPLEDLEQFGVERAGPNQDL